MKKYLWSTPCSIVHLYRPDHVDDQYTVHTEIQDDAALERNKRIRLEDLVKQGKPMPLHDGAPIEFAYSIPNEHWAFFKRDHPDIVEGIRSKDHETRRKACRELSILHPEWVITAGNW